MAKRSKSSDRWLQRQRKDYFVRQAQGGGQISRAHFKLEQIDKRFRIVKPKQRVLELGAAPGGWTHYLEGKLQGGLLIAVDPLPITSGQETHVIEGLAGDETVNEDISTILDGQQLDYEHNYCKVMNDVFIIINNNLIMYEVLLVYCNL